MIFKTINCIFLEIFKGQYLNPWNNHEKSWFYSWSLGSYASLSPQKGIIGESNGIYFKELWLKY